jgi:hypothetical protein
MTGAANGKLFAAIVSAAVIAVIIRALLLIGPLDEQRKMKFDARRVSDLQQLTASIDAYAASHKALPESLNELEKEQAVHVPIMDPETGNLYSYKVISADTYELCAQFSGASADRLDYRWGHRAGNACFRMKVRL